MSKVEKTFSFASWATDHPSDPIPGDRIDIQFDNHRAAIRRLEDAIARLVRADGKLNHGLLTEESLPQDALMGLARKTEQRLQDFADPLIAQARLHLRELEQTQLDLQAALAEVKARQREADKLLASTSSISQTVHDHARQAMALVTRAANVQAQFVEDQNWKDLQANTAEDWALVSTVWAEFMDGNATIPPNILASNSITGDHWSSRWWAHRAAGAAGMLAWWYQGAWPGVPPSTPNDPTGQPLPPGSIYFDTDDNKMYVWTGSSWVPLAQGPAAATTSSLYYLATAGQTVFNLTSNDHFGASFGFNQTHPEGLHALVNGVRLVPTDDYAVNVASSTVTLARPMVLNAVVGFDILTPVSQLSPSGSAKTYLLSPLAPDGVATVFTLTVAAGSPVVNVAHNEELMVSVDGVQQSPGQAYNASGNQITFAQAPDQNSLVFIVWFGPDMATRSAPAPVKLVSSFTPTTEYDSFAGHVGMTFALTADMSFNQIGMRCGTGDQTVVVSLNKNDGSFTQIASATIDFTGVATGDFKYVDVPQFTLTGDSATTYTLSADFSATGAGQFWCGSSPCVIQNQFSMSSVYFNSPPPTANVANEAYVGLDLALVSP